MNDSFIPAETRNISQCPENNDSFFFLFFFQITRIQNRNQENNSIFSTNSVRLKEEKNNKFIR